MQFDAEVKTAEDIIRTCQYTGFEGTAEAMKAVLSQFEQLRSVTQTAILSNHGEPLDTD